MLNFNNTLSFLRKTAGKFFFAPERLGYWIAFLFCFSYCAYKHELPFYHDSSGYWNFGKLFLVNGEFSILNYNTPLRGYSLPFVNFLCQQVAAALKMSEIDLFRILSSFLFPYFTYFLFPNFFQKAFGVIFDYRKRFIFFVLFFIFWRGYILYPLTDFFSFFAIVGSLFCTYLVIEKEHQTGAVLVGASGFLAALAVNMRPSYMVIIFPLLIYVLWCLVKSKKYFFNRTLFWILGFILALFPQIAINAHHFETYSPTIQMEKFYGGVNLMHSKLLNGLTIQKYETYVGKEQPYSVIVVQDLNGKQILDNEKIVSFSSYSEYFNILKKYPLDIMSMYLRHIFNGMDIQFETPYIDVFYEPLYKTVFRILNYSVLFYFISLLVAYIAKVNLTNQTFSGKVFIERAIIIAILILPMFVSMPTEPEVRFFLPLYLLIYGFISVSNYRLIFNGGTIRSKALTLVSYILFVSVILQYSRHMETLVKFQ